MPNTYFTRTPGSTTNQQIFTWSSWVKRDKLGTGTDQYLFASDNFNTSSNRFVFQIIFKSTGTEQLVVGLENSVSGTDGVRQTTQVFRDTSAWYHIVAAVDTTQATASNRIKVYVNGSEVTSFATNTNPTQNANVSINQSGSTPAIGAFILNTSPQRFFSGYLAGTYLIDGQALTPSSFGETDATTGIWKPKSYAGSYGTNGFFLKFANSASLGTDSSGNGNNFTVGGGTPTQTLDTPSNVFATLNALDINAITLTQGNLLAGSTGATWKSTRSTLGVSKGKWYWEMKATASASSYDCQIGVGLFSLAIASFGEWSSANPSVIYTAGSGEKILNGTTSAYGATYTVGDIIGVAFDADNLTVTFYKNGTSQGAITTGWSADTYAAEIALYGRSGGTTSGSFNFGNGYFQTTAISSPYSDGAGLGKFQYQPPAGYYALCTKNINVYG